MISSEHTDSTGPTSFDVREYSYDESRELECSELRPVCSPLGEPMMTTEQKTTTIHRRIAAILGGFAVALLLGVFPARQAAARTCLSGERVLMAEPAVELIGGPGDPLAEQMWWSEMDVFLLEVGRVYIYDDHIIKDYDLTRIP